MAVEIFSTDRETRTARHSKSSVVKDVLGAGRASLSDRLQIQARIEIGRRRRSVANAGIGHEEVG